MVSQGIQVKAEPQGTQVKKVSKEILAYRVPLANKAYRAYKAWMVSRELKVTLEPEVRLVKRANRDLVDKWVR
jgi:hypothetical protein